MIPTNVVRPIPEEMMYYARSDTHYLLYIYDRVRNDLIEASDRSDPDKDFIARALHKSQELSLSRHEHPDFNVKTGDGTRGWYSYVLKHSHLGYSSDQFAVFRALWQWRDTTARKEDESPNFVLGTHNLGDVARVNPPDAKALHSLLPMTAPLARSRVNEIWGEIQATKAEDGPSLLHFFTSLAPEALGKNGVPRLAKAQAKLPELDGEVTVGRLPRSQLFGDMPISSRWEESPDNEGEDAQIPFPWQRFVQAATEDELVAAGNGAITAEELPAHDILELETPVKIVEPVEDVDEEFTLKRGKKRKAPVAEEQSSSSEEESEGGSDQEMAEDADTGGILSMDDDRPKKNKLSKKERRRERKPQGRQAEQGDSSRNEAKAERKAKKQEKKLKQREADAEKQKKLYEAVPFDYSQASTVMHAERGPKTAEEGVQRRKRMFDPYSKTGDEPLKGARKAMPVRGERSATFKK